MARNRPDGRDDGTDLSCGDGSGGTRWIGLSALLIRTLPLRKLTVDGYVFSDVPGGGTPLLPDSVTQRFRRRLARRHGVPTTLHSFGRHYAATQLLAAGVDLRTVAGRWGTVAVARPPCGCTPRSSPRPTAAPPSCSANTSTGRASFSQATTRRAPAESRQRLTSSL